MGEIIDAEHDLHPDQIIDIGHELQPDQVIDTAHDLRPIKTVGPEKDYRLEVLAAPYGGVYGGKDATKQYFSPRTDFMINIGDKRPVIYYHGNQPDGKQSFKPEVIGVGTALRRDVEGLWFDVVLDHTKAFAHRIWGAAKKGMAAASSGSVNYLIRIAKGGEILSWPLSELTLIDVGRRRHPANELAVVNLKTLYEEAHLEFPEVFAKDAEASAELEGSADEQIHTRQQVITATVAAIVAYKSNSKGGTNA